MTAYVNTPFTDKLSAHTSQDRVGNLISTTGLGDTLNGHGIALLRCMIAVTVLLTSVPTKSDPLWLIEWTFASFVVYLSYSIIVAIVSYRSNRSTPPKKLYWIDVLFFAWLVTLTYTSGNNLYQCFFFPIFVASFSKGFREGLEVAFAAFLLLIAIGFGSFLTGGHFGSGNRNALILADYVVVLGYIISFCGSNGGLFMRRMSLLKEVNNIWQPRIGVDQLYGNNLDRLLEFFGGNTCLLVLQQQDTDPSYVMYTAYRDKPGNSAVQYNVAESVAKNLLHNLPGMLAAYYHNPAGSLWRKIRGHRAYDINTGVKSISFHDECAALANLLEANIFATVPYVQHGCVTGRIFVTADHGIFTNSDFDFLLQASNAMSSAIESMHLVEELVSNAAKQERSNISRDLHDTTIQPSIGLKLALEALSREVAEDNPLSPRIREIIEMAEMTVSNLRDFAAMVKEKKAIPGEAMIAAVKNQSERLKRYYGINVETTCEISNQLKGQLAAEVLQIISEGQSNILRHTKAKNAFVSILCKDSKLHLEIGNDKGDSKAFTPRSISERVHMLNGLTCVEHRQGQHTVVAVTIPM